ncbi:MAG: ribonuclease R [Planctomycetota bacterium]
MTREDRSSGGSSLPQQILTAVQAVDYVPITAKELRQQLEVRREELEDFAAAITTLVAGGRLREDKRGRLKPRGSIGTITGVLRRITSGAAWVIPSQRAPELHGADVYIAATDVGDAQTGDEVLVRLLSRRRGGGQRCGVIDRVLERASTTFVGTYFETGGQGYVRVDGTNFSAPIHVGDPGAKGAQPDDKVVLDMLRFPTDRRRGEGVVTQVLGRRGDPGIDTLTVIHSLGLPVEFSPEALAEARTQAALFDEESLSGREDLTAETIVTIDPADARDFDDAISLSRSEDGSWHLGVHIADVSHFVPEGSQLDREAQLRGTSVYLPGHVIPMLPEMISNGLASLQQGQLRYTKSVFIEFAADGSVRGSQVASTVIRTARRFAYEDVMPIINQPNRTFPDVTDSVRQLLLHMHQLAMLLRKKRFAQGALQMGIPEIEIVFGRDGAVQGAKQRHHDESHEIIEEFMLAANIAVAKLLASRGIPFLRRVHNDPDELRINSFQQFCQGLGLTLRKPQSRHELQALIRSVSGKPLERAVNFALLRSMKQAEYSPEIAGHYALAETDYCHFTSPIRRYPDLTVHRLLDRLIHSRPIPKPPSESLQRLAKHCSFTERRAERAERELIRIRLLRFMAQRVGSELEATITGIESFGMFCQGLEIPAEGMVHLSALGDDFFEFDSVGRTLTGQRTRQVFRLGDNVRVQVVAVDIDRRQMELRPVRFPGRSRRGPEPFPPAHRFPASAHAPETTEQPPRRSSGKPSEKPPGKSSAPPGKSSRKPPGKSSAAESGRRRDDRPKSGRGRSRGKPR